MNIYLKCQCITNVDECQRNNIYTRSRNFFLTISFCTQNKIEEKKKNKMPHQALYSECASVLNWRVFFRSGEDWRSRVSQVKITGWNRIEDLYLMPWKTLPCVRLEDSWTTDMAKENANVCSHWTIAMRCTHHSTDITKKYRNSG